jgi:hypothetical protein
MEYFKFVESNTLIAPGATVNFTHNLDNFDGYFLYKALSSYANPDSISTIINAHNSFIQITFKTSTSIPCLLIFLSTL